MLFIAQNLTITDAESIGREIFALDDQTLGYIAAIGNTSLTDDYKVALNNLLIGMQTNSLFDEVKGLYLPAFADDITKTLVNAADAGFAVDLVPDNAKLGLTAGKGLYVLLSGDGATLNIPISGKGLTNESMHFLVKPYNTGTKWGFMTPYNAGSDSFTVQVGTALGTANATNSKIGARALESILVISDPSGNGVYGWSIVGDDINTPTGATQTIASGTLATLSTAASLVGFNGTSGLEPNALISIGTGLTPARMAIYVGLIETFIAAIGGDVIV